MARQIFRQEALDRLSSPERLDQLMEVASRRSWIALAGAGLLLLTGLLWGVFGSIPSTVEAQGVLMRRGITPLEAPSRGVVEKILVNSGDQVEKDQQVVLLARPGSATQKPTPVVSPFAGRVLGWRARVGDMVETGTPLLMLEPLNEPLQARLFIPVSDGYQVQPGMAVQVWPTHVRRGEFGYLIGRVGFASKFPVTQEDMLRIVQNDELVRQLSQTGPCLQVMVELSRDPKTVSGYRWSSPRGAPLELYSGTPCRARVIISAQRPIQLVFPTLGGSQAEPDRGRNRVEAE